MMTVDNELFSGTDDVITNEERYYRPNIEIRNSDPIIFATETEEDSKSDTSSKDSSNDDLDEKYSAKDIEKVRKDDRKFIKTVAVVACLCCLFVSTGIALGSKFYYNSHSEAQKTQIEADFELAKKTLELENVNANSTEKTDSQKTDSASSKTTTTKTDDTTTNESITPRTDSTDTQTTTVPTPSIPTTPTPNQSSNTVPLIQQKENVNSSIQKPLASTQNTVITNKTGSRSSIAINAKKYVTRTDITGWEVVQKALFDSGYQTQKVSDIYNIKSFISPITGIAYEAIVPFVELGNIVNSNSLDKIQAGDIVQFGSINSQISSQYMGVVGSDGKVIIPQNGRVVNVSFPKNLSVTRIIRMP